MILFIPLFVVITCVNGGSRSYYVDYVNGSDASSGTSVSSPWKHSPGDSCASANAAQVLGPGDTVFFKGGTAYEGTVAIPWSGKGGSPLVYDGNSSGRWGTGKAVIDGDNSRSNGFASSARSVHYVTVKNFEIKAIKYTGVEWAGGAGIKIDDGDHVTIADCFIHDVGYWNNDGSTVPAGAGVAMVRPSHCLITGNEITKTGLAGIQLSGAQHNVISRNNVHDYLTWGVDLGGDYRVCTGNCVCDNTIHDLFRYDKEFWKGTGDPPHTDFCFIRKGSGFHPVNNIVERNLFFNNGVFADFGGTAMLFLSYADSTVVRNNIFINAHSYSAVFLGWTSTGTKFYNNTVYCPRTGALRLSTSGDNTVRNNIVISQSTGITYDSVADERNLVMDHNLYCMPYDDKMFVRVAPWAGWNFLAWQGRGYDAQSVLLPSASSFKFVNIDGYPLQCHTMNLQLRPGSPAVRAGSRLQGFADDMSGNERAQSGAWDIGAYACVPNFRDSLAGPADHGQRK
jgi:Right handed beta helix region